MNQRFNRRMQGFVLTAFATAGSSCLAQPDPGCQFANILLGALGGRNSSSVPCAANGQAATGTPAAPFPGQQRQGLNSLYTPQNVQRIVQSVKTDLSLIDPTSPEVPDLPSCAKEMSKFPPEYRPQVSGNFRNDVYGYDVLQRECEQQTQGAFTQFQVRRRDAGQQRLVAQKEVEQRAQAAADAQKAQADAAQDKIFNAELRSGKRAPVNCPTYAISKGMDPDTLKAPVMHVAYGAPKGMGQFVGAIAQMDSEIVVLTGNIPEAYRLMGRPADNFILTLNRNTKVFDPEEIRMGTVVVGYATQTGTRSATLRNGVATTVAVMSGFCWQPVR